MPPATPVENGLYCLTLGNGQSWHLRPVGDEAIDVVSRLAAVMTLSRCSQGREILVRVQEGARQLPVITWESAPGICILPPGENDAMKIIQMTTCATSLAFHPAAVWRASDPWRSGRKGRVRYHPCRPGDRGKVHGLQSDPPPVACIE